MRCALTKTQKKVFITYKQFYKNTLQTKMGQGCGTRTETEADLFIWWLKQLFVILTATTTESIQWKKQKSSLI